MRSRHAMKEELGEVEREMRYMLRFRKLSQPQQLRVAELRGMQQALKYAIGDDLAEAGLSNDSDPASSAPLIPQSRAEEMVAEEREECIRLFRENLEPLIYRHLNNDVACGLRDAEEAIRARKTETPR